jgi:hypothetical protein
MMDKVKEMKMERNLEIPESKKISGIMSSYPFHVLRVGELDSMVRVLGGKLGNSIMHLDSHNFARLSLDNVATSLHVTPQ